MQHKLHILPLCITIIMLFVTAHFTSCRRGNSVSIEALTAIDSLVEEHPDSALALLRAIDTADIRSSECGAYYALLLTEAEDKNYIDRDDDNLISRASYYYFEHPKSDRDRAIRAFFYHARILYNARNYAEASEMLSKAMVMARNCGAHYWLGRIYVQFANLYNATFSYDKALENLEQAVIEYKIAHNEEYLMYAYSDLITAYINCRQFTKALSSVDDMKAMPLPIDLIAQCIRSQALANHYLGNNSMARQKYRELMTLEGGNYSTSMDYSTLASIYYAEAIPDSMDLAIRNAQIMAIDAVDSAHVLYQKIHYNLLLGNDDAISSQLNAFVSDLNDRWIVASSNHPSIGVSNYYQYRSMLEATQRKFDSVVSAIILAVSVVILVLIIMYYRQFKRRKEAEIITVLTKYNELLSNVNVHQQSESSDIRGDKIRALQSELLSQRFKYVNSLCKMEFNYLMHDQDVTTGQAKLMLGDLSKIIESLGNDVSILELENTLNQCDNNIVIHLKDALPSLKYQDEKLATMLFAGMSSHTICLALKINNLATYRSRKNRLKQMIEMSNSPWTALLLSRF